MRSFSGWESLLSSSTAFWTGTSTSNGLRRQRIWRHLSAGEVSLATAAMQAYQAADVLEHQFLQTAKLNLRALQGAAVEELRDLALAALLLTQPSRIDHGEPAAFESK